MSIRINWRQNLPLIVGLAIPVLMVIAIFVVIYIPRLTVKPQTNFVYAVGAYPVYEDYTQTPPQRHGYQVTNDQLKEVVTPIQTDSSNPYDPYYSRDMAPAFYRYDVVQQRSQELSWDEAQKIKLDKNDISVDGFHVEQGGRGGSIFDLFGSSSSYNNWFLVGHNASLKLNLQNVASNNSYGYGQVFYFVGWIK